MPRLKSVGTVPSDPSERRKNDLTLVLLQPHPRPFSKWRGGVDSIISKQRGRFFDVKRRPLQSEGGVPLIKEHTNL